MEIYKDLNQFSLFVPPIQMATHQYLLMSESPVLVQTGTIQQTEAIIPQIKELLKDRKLEYVLFSHFESDECGGIFLLQKEYPEITAVCSEVSARQLHGFGYTGKVLIQKQGDILNYKGFEFTFVNYPSEMHLWDGIVCYENTRRIFFSSDLMFMFGEGAGKTRTGDWKTEVQNIRIESLSDENKLNTLKQGLLEISPAFIATGHGICITVTGA